jgi:hypothetical protein
LNVVRSCRISTLIGIVRLATTRRDAETFPYDVDGIGEMSLWIHCFNQIAGDVAAMFESGEEPIWIQLSPFTRNEWINAYTQFEFGHHKHDHACSSGAGSPEHMATVSFKHRG